MKIDPNRLVSFDGFLQAFWREYRESGGTQREVFGRLNAAYLKAFGVPRFRTFDAFRKQRDRRRR